MERPLARATEATSFIIVWHKGREVGEEAKMCPVRRRVTAVREFLLGGGGGGKGGDGAGGGGYGGGTI
jgi:hypothetical protein